MHQKIAKNPYFYRLKKDGQVINSTMAKLLTQKRPKNGQDINSTAYIYIEREREREREKEKKREIKQEI